MQTQTFLIRGLTGFYKTHPNNCSAGVYHELICPPSAKDCAQCVPFLLTRYNSSVHVHGSASKYTLKFILT